jgi:putative spermidine/putrescine transport system permease protein
VIDVRSKFRLGKALFIAAIALYVAIVLGILLTVVLNSVSKGWYSGLLPKTLTTEWYKYAAADHDIPGIVGATFVVAIADVVVGLLIAFPAAYALARSDFRGKALLLSLFLLPMIVPPMAYGIPLAMLCYKFHLAGRIIGTVVVNLVPIVPFMILVLMPFIEQVGTNLESAAKMLGARRGTIFRKILIPLTAPGILTAGILSLVKSISMFELSYLVVGGRNQTIVVALFSDAYAAGARPPQSVDALAVVYFLIAMSCLLISLRFVSPTQMVFKLK